MLAVLCNRFKFKRRVDGESADAVSQNAIKRFGLFNCFISGLGGRAASGFTQIALTICCVA